MRALRSLLVEVAEDLCVGPLTETLKWGEPAYLTEVTKAGTTVRIAWKPATPSMIGAVSYTHLTLPTSG